MNYVVAVFGDRIQAEAAYTQLESAGLPMEGVSIAGRGYKTAEELGLVDPKTKARQQMWRMVTWTAPFGFLAGVGFSLSSGLQTFTPWAGAVGNHVVGGLLGAIAGAMGGAFVGGGVGLSNAQTPLLRNRLDEGKYLVIVRANTANEVQQNFGRLLATGPEELQTYGEM